MYNIDKVFEMDYAHKVWNQSLNSLFSLTGTCKCRRLHGHHGVLKIGLQSEKLNNGMVTDFNHLAWLKRIVDDVVDHRFIIDCHDPMLPMLFPEVKEYQDCLNATDWYTMFDMDKLAEAVTDSDIKSIILEKCSSMVLVNFVPTSENLCKWFYDIASEEMKEFADAEGFKVGYVDFWETPKSHCHYEP